MRRWRKQADRLMVEISWSGDLPLALTDKPLSLAQSIELSRWLDAVRGAPPEHFENRATSGICSRA